MSEVAAAGYSHARHFDDLRVEVQRLTPAVKQEARGAVGLSEVVGGSTWRRISGGTGETREMDSFFSAGFGMVKTSLGVARTSLLRLFK